MSKGRDNDIFKQLQELMNKCDNLTKEIEIVKKETELKTSGKYDKVITSLNNRLDLLEKENKQLKIESIEKDKKIVLLENEVDRLKKQINNNSDNSSKPPSTDIKPNKMIIPNNRMKSAKKTGGQFGHKGHTISKSKIEEQIKNNEVYHEIINHGKLSSEKYVVKYEVSTKLIVTVKEHRFYPDEKGKYNIEKKYKNDVFYGDELKSLCSYFSIENSMPINKIVATLSTLTNKKLEISEGSIVNFIQQLNKKSFQSIDEIKTQILNSDLIYTDETSTRCSGKRMSIRNYSTATLVLYKANPNKSNNSIKSNNILNVFTGDIVHDHDTVMYHYGNRNVECNVHICRYLKGNTENTKNNWSIELREYLNRINMAKKIAIEYNQNEFIKEDLKKYEIEYDNILLKGFEQTKETESKYYKDNERKLLNRLKKYKENHLLFIHDFSLPFDNNQSERDIRLFKIKTKISGGFRSLAGINAYTNILSIVKTSKKQGLNVLNIITDLYKNSTVNI